MPITNKNTAIVLDTLNKKSTEPTALLFNVISEEHAKLLAGGSAVSIGKISEAHDLADDTKYDSAVTKNQSIYRYFENMTLPFYIEYKTVQPIGDGANVAVAFTNKQKGYRKHFAPVSPTARHYVSTQHGIAVTEMPKFTLRERPNQASTSTNAVSVAGIISGYMRFKNNPNPMSVFCFSTPDTNPVVATTFSTFDLADTGLLVDYLGNTDINVSLHATGDQ